MTTSAPSDATPTRADSTGQVPKSRDADRSPGPLPVGAADSDTGPATVLGVYRRAFITGATAAAAAACSSPERSLVSDADIDAVELGAADRDEQPASTSPPSGDPIIIENPAEVLDVPDEDLAGLVLVAEADGESVEIFAEPGGEVTHTLANPIPSGGPLVFVVDQYGAEGWHKVLLPVRPNGATGWVHEAEITLTRHNYRILIELDEFRCTAFDHEVPFFEGVVGVARDNTPTPGGRYYITELIQPIVSDSIYGIYAYGLSGYSEVLEEFNGGPGQLGLHGTNDPDTLGTKVSSGCIRLHNDEITLLVERGLPLGTPVEVV